MLPHLSVFKNLAYVLHSSLSIYSILLISLSLIQVIASCIQEFRSLPFRFLPGGYHSKNFRGNLSSFILRTWFCRDTINIYVYLQSWKDVKELYTYTSKYYIVLYNVWAMKVRREIVKVKLCAGISLILSKSTKGAARRNFPTWRTNLYQQYICPHNIRTGI